MAINKLTRRLALTLSVVLIVLSSIFILTPTTASAKVLVTNDGKIPFTVDSDVNTGTVDIPAQSNKIFSNLRFYLNGSTGIVLITLVLTFVIKCGQLAAAADNATKRGNHITGLLVIGICVGLLGSFHMIMSWLVIFAGGI